MQVQRRVEELTGAKNRLAAEVVRLTDNLAAADMAAQGRTHHESQQPKQSAAAGSPPAMAGPGLQLSRRCTCHMQLHSWPSTACALGCALVVTGSLLIDCVMAPGDHE